VTGRDRVFAVASVAIAALLFAGFRPVFAGRFENGAPSLAYGLVVSLVVVASSYFLLRRSMAASDRSFQLAFFGGILGRLAAFAAAVAVAFGVSGLSGRASALAMVTGFIPLSALEIVCVLKAHRYGPKENRDA
jgi:hypothetical protein